MTDLTRNQKILQWLNTLGYSVKMKVAKSLTSSGFDVVKSSFYEDPENPGASLEIDIIGRLTDIVGLFQVYSVIECKKSLNPWVVFTSENTSYNRLGAFAIMSRRANQAVSNNLLQLLELDWFVKNGRMGYGITEAFALKENVIFKALLSSTKASISIIKQEMKSLKSDFLSFIFPTIVLDGCLFESYLGKDDSLIIAEIDSATILFPINIGGYTCSGIRVVTLKSFDRYCAELKSVYQSLNDKLSPDVKRIADTIR